MTRTRRPRKPILQFFWLGDALNALNNTAEESRGRIGIEFVPWTKTDVVIANIMADICGSTALIRRPVGHSPIGTAGASVSDAGMAVTEITFSSSSKHQTHLNHITVFCNNLAR